MSVISSTFHLQRRYSPPVILFLIFSIIKISPRTHPAVMHGRINIDIRAERTLVKDSLVLGVHVCRLLLGGEDDVRNDCVFGICSVVQS
jgi:hypothetical protein